MAGVTPKDMFRHILGEDPERRLRAVVGGPAGISRSSFFEGKVNSLSQKELPDALRTSRVSGFPSQHAGHLCLLRLKEDDYPNTTRIEQWPTWDLAHPQVGEAAGRVVGFSHSGWGWR